MSGGHREEQGEKGDQSSCRGAVLDPPSADKPAVVGAPRETQAGLRGVPGPHPHAHTPRGVTGEHWPGAQSPTRWLVWAPAQQSGLPSLAPFQAGATFPPSSYARAPRTSTARPRSQPFTFGTAPPHPVCGEDRWGYVWVLGPWLGRLRPMTCTVSSACTEPPSLFSVTLYWPPSFLLVLGRHSRVTPSLRATWAPPRLPPSTWAPSFLQVA